MEAPDGKIYRENVGRSNVDAAPRRFDHSIPNDHVRTPNSTGGAPERGKPFSLQEFRTSENSGNAMNKPQYSLFIKGKEFSCLGQQLMSIIEDSSAFLKDAVWYAADVEINGEFPYKLGLDKRVPKKIGPLNKILELSKGVDQFLSGLFFALPHDVGDVWQREFFTEDESYRDMEEAILEIRAFDTSFFVVYSNDFALMKKLSEDFYGIIEYRDGNPYEKIRQQPASRAPGESIVYDAPTNPNCSVRIKGKSSNCSGQQLLAILQTIESSIKNVIWYASDLKIKTKISTDMNYRDSKPTRMGSTADLMQLCQNVEQFLSGVFLATEVDEGEQLPILCNTNDIEFRDIGNAQIEIRAYDTSYFEIYTKKSDLIHLISKNFYGIVTYNLAKNMDWRFQNECL